METSIQSVDLDHWLNYANEATAMIMGFPAKWDLVGAPCCHAYTQQQSATIRMVEAAGDRLLIRLTGSVASTRTVAALLTGDTKVSDDQVDDLLGEWCNLMAGSIKASLPGQGRMGVPLSNRGDSIMQDWMIAATLAIEGAPPLMLTYFSQSN